MPNTYWLDESGTNCGMTRLYGRAFFNESVNDYVPDVRFERTSVIAALGLNGIAAPSLSAHKVNGAFDSLIEKGVTVKFQPRYSPDFNPIENAWSKIKAYLRKVKARTFDTLFSAIGEALNTITNNDIVGWV